MIRPRASLLFLAAFLAGGGAAYLTYHLIQNPTGGADRVPGEFVDLVHVAVAARDLPVGHLLAADDLQMAPWPAHLIPPGSAQSRDDLVGRGLIVAVYRHEPMLPAKVAPEGMGGGLANLIPEGKRAMAVRVDDVVGVAGFVVPGTRVDVLATLEDRVGNPSSQAVAQVILQNVEVLATGQSIERDLRNEPRPTTVVTLLVTPHEGERLGLAASQGRIQLALRNSMDHDLVETSGARIVNLTGSDGLPRPTPAGPRLSVPLKVEVYRGLDRSEASILAGGGGS
jgi:pilus assembly protein CpaB